MIILIILLALLSSSKMVVDVLSFREPIEPENVVRNYDMKGPIIVFENYVQITPNGIGKSSIMNGKYKVDLPSFELQLKLNIICKEKCGGGMGVWLTEEKLKEGDLFGAYNIYKGIGIFINFEDVDIPMISVLKNDGVDILKYKPEMYYQCSVANIQKDKDGAVLRIKYLVNEKKLIIEIMVNHINMDCITIEDIDIPPFYLGISATNGGSGSTSYRVQSLHYYEVGNKERKEVHLNNVVENEQINDTPETKAEQASNRIKERKQNNINKEKQRENERIENLQKLEEANKRLNENDHLTEENKKEETQNIKLNNSLNEEEEMKEQITIEEDKKQEEIKDQQIIEEQKKQEEIVQKQEHMKELKRIRIQDGLYKIYKAIAPMKNALDKVAQVKKDDELLKLFDGIVVDENNKAKNQLKEILDQIELGKVSNNVFGVRSDLVQVKVLFSGVQQSSWKIVWIVLLISLILAAYFAFKLSMVKKINHYD
ncbi:lectin family protein [Entamoeba histolytica HM-1:IMSS-B]|uniref:Legume-like lectin family protein n=6 Tax=Entamoeba histolytica TaxID=5759 RepID=C4LSN9_ENTH1|nr:Legume-like lectin family protein [Entamoeba histolytica HM-1:IMSS]EMD46606.1 vesicular mannose-binding lectin, putative [Entamoeba histolytica KU27]EMH76379.1 lectin family protein [Entamoeba histolytica HM-1:IMSS-B]EMS17246.1 vesicular mannose-binding lectin, putative [Entamoeba histolytica HM-3:IMSS]ENY59884.1 vesicular mannose-binding lectin, putative [Entamoeba histolytica HM-1:IMSS-A]GAT91449.1 legume-like lectin family protein membrane-bound [Entamoeba histolytica]|eukprot:XP_657380.1 Legume-like lectin family protein [Entamoeba histolytica HM-1:IMSS]